MPEHTRYIIKVITADNNTKEGSIDVTIEKAAPSFTTPTIPAVKCNAKLSDISLPDGFTFVNPHAELTIGDNKIYVIYTPIDTDNYNVVGSIAVTITVEEHEWDAPVYTWSDDFSSCNAKIVCQNDASHVQATEDATVTSEVKIPPTATKTGTITYTASFNNPSFTTQTKDIDIPALLTGSGTKDAPYIIYTPDDLDNLSNTVNNGDDCWEKYFILGDDITYTYDDNTQNNFTAIGDWAKPFKGNFNGDGKKISGIRIYKPNDFYQGLFGCISKANVENIILTDTKITGFISVGGIAGMCDESTIRNCIVDNVFVNGSSQGCGGIAGTAYLVPLVGNLIVNSTITVANPDKYIYTGAIVGDSDGSLESNYYYNCKVIVGENEKNTDVGCGQNGTLPHDIDGARQAVQISAAEGITFQITSDNPLTYEDQIYVGVGTVTLTISDDKVYKYYTNGKGVYFTNVDGNSYNFTVTDANDIVITGTNENPVEGKISISAIDNQITILPKENAVLLDGKCYAEDGATATLAINDIYRPDEGYTVSGYTYAEGESLTKNADGNYTFTVPSDDVTISRVTTDVWNVENGADGSADNPYIITTPAGLDLLATKVIADVYYQKHFELGADIDYKDVPKDESGSNFTPIGKDRDYSFKGSFDGKEYTISGIVLNSENASFQGLFGYVGYDWSRPNDYYIVKNGYYIVKNVILASSTIKGSDLVGGIAGGSAGMISNCTVKSDVKIYARRCGGILGFNNGFVENCTSSAQLEGNGNNKIGGIAGESCRHGLANNRAIGVKISGTFQYAGAITPYTTNEDSLHNNFYLNCMVLDKTAGIGYNGEDFTKNNGAVPVHSITLCDGITITTDPSITYNETNYYAQGTVLELQKNIATTYYANGEEISGETFTMPAKDVTFTRDYIITYNLNGGTLPTGTDNPTKFTVESGEITLPTPTHEYGTFGGWYGNSSFNGDAITTINSAEAKDINLYAKWDIVSITEIKTTDDLIYFANTVKAGNTYEGKTVTLMNDIDFEPTEETETNFTAIGTFRGTFDGGNHTIRGIRINKPNAPAIGLFGNLYGTVQNVNLADTKIIAHSNVGGIAGGNSGAIKNCSVAKDVYIEGNYSTFGGIVGYNNGTVSGCISSATITATITANTGNGNQVGGIVGYNSGGTISNCTATADANVNGNEECGGIAGRNNYISGSNYGTVSGCISSATITANNYVGGIVGYINGGTISNCTATADANVNGQYICGGIAGSNTKDYPSTIENCTSSATIKAGFAGGIVGYLNSGTFKNNLVIDAKISGNATYGAIAGVKQGNSITLQNNFYYNTTVNDVNNATSVGCNGADIEAQNGAVHLDLIIDGDSESPVAITESQTGANVLYLRKLKAGVTSTIILPFAFDASSMPGIFYQLTSVNTDDWKAGANKVTGELSANTPYLFLPSADIEQTVFTKVKLTPTSGDNSVTIDDNWTFHGVYEKILWETAPKNHYGFSGINKGDIAAGAFVKIGQYVFIKPTRAYLTYDDGISKSAIVLPDRIHVIFSDEEIASVIDPIDTPTDDPTEDITTPVSELPAQASNVKVWSYEKTIYIQAAPDTDYRIIDATGRVLRSATTQTDRDEIRLGHHSGIVIVIINNKTYKINY